MRDRFKNTITFELYCGIARKGMPSDIVRVARRKLQQVVRSVKLTDLSVPPNNRLEALKGNRKGQYSIRVNDKWRICFVWSGHDAQEIEFVDYH